MTDDPNLTPGGEMNEAPSMLVEIRTDTEGHWVVWAKDEESGRLGPYLDAKTSEKVRASKELELTLNNKPIDEARP